MYFSGSILSAATRWNQNLFFRCLLVNPFSGSEVLTSGKALEDVFQCFGGEFFGGYPAAAASEEVADAAQVFGQGLLGIVIERGPQNAFLLAVDAQLHAGQRRAPKKGTPMRPHPRCAPESGRHAPQ